MNTINKFSSAPIQNRTAPSQQTQAKAAKTELTDKVALSDPKESDSFFTPGKLALAGLVGVVGLGAVAAAPAQAHETSVGITIGGDGWGVTIGGGHHGHHRGPHGHRGHHRGGHHDHGHRQRVPGHGGHHRHRGGNYDYRHGHGMLWEGVGMDGQWHVFDSHNHVNDNTGHYQFRYNAWGQLVRDYNVNY